MTSPIIKLAVEAHDDPELHDAFIIFGALHAQCLAMCRWMMHDGFVWPIRSRIPEDHKVVQAMVSRAARWMHSISQLQWPDDYQAFAAGCRALLESAADVTLITHDPTLIDWLHAWDESAKLKVCERLREARHGGIAGAAAATFITNNGTRIKADRLSRWRTHKHPKTWLGPSLPDMLKTIDDKVGTDFEFTYATNYDRLCWGTHGSGLQVERMPRSFMVQECCTSMVVALRLTNDLIGRALGFLGIDRAASMNQLAASMKAAESAFHAAVLETIARRASKQ